jgi:tRNA A37 threonylcarbamoyladenosine dehydratase
MEESMYTRTENMLGEEAVQRLRAARVIIFGVGGVGGFAAEALARIGIGEITVVDNDVVSPSNINRQIIALNSTIGKYKVDCIKERILDINPEARVITHAIFYPDKAAPVLNFAEYDYVLDCIDTLKSKLTLIEQARGAGARIISAMGAGNKLDPTRLKVADISKTSGDPLARRVRTELRKMGINHLKVVFSDEAPAITGERTPPSLPTLPSVMGLIMASEVIRDIIGG